MKKKFKEKSKNMKEILSQKNMFGAMIENQEKRNWNKLWWKNVSCSWEKNIKVKANIEICAMKKLKMKKMRKKWKKRYDKCAVDFHLWNFKFKKNQSWPLQKHKMQEIGKFLKLYCGIKFFKNNRVDLEVKKLFET